mmetsp:Transcript_18972/g.21953  ORF Transcript_18972/g.21953 Transcript_18972/m.21953 type:complete len:88 (-) Transcript_18972:48-311(-)
MRMLNVNARLSRSSSRSRTSTGIKLLSNTTSRDTLPSSSIEKRPDNAILFDKLGMLELEQEEDGVDLQLRLCMHVPCLITYNMTVQS